MKFELTPEAKKLRKELQADKLSKKSERFQESISHSDEFWYILTQGWNVIDPILADDEQKNKLRDAIELVQHFESLYSDLALEM